MASSADQRATKALAAWARHAAGTAEQAHEACGFGALAASDTDGEDDDYELSKHDNVKKLLTFRTHIYCAKEHHSGRPPRSHTPQRQGTHEPHELPMRHCVRHRWRA